MENLRLSKKIFLLFFSVLVSLVILELSCELIHSYIWKQANKRIKPYYQFSFYTENGKRIGDKRGWLKLMFHPQVGYINFPNQETPCLFINSRGFRGPEIDIKKEGRKRIILVGGSTAFGTGLDHNSQTFAYQLEKNLANVEVINASVIGHRSGQELTYLITELIDLEPDLIIAFDGGNDFFQIGKPYQKWPDFNGADDFQNELNRLNKLVYSNFLTRMINTYQIVFGKTINAAEKSIGRFVNLLKNAVSDDMKSKIKKSFFYPDRDRKLDVDKVSDSYTRNIQKISRLAKSYDAHFLCLIQPTRSSIEEGLNENDQKAVYRDFRLRVKERLAGDNIKYIDLNDYTNELSVDMFMDEAHLDAQGNKIMATIVGKKIQKENLL